MSLASQRPLCDFTSPQNSPRNSDALLMAACASLAAGPAPGAIGEVAMGEMIVIGGRPSHGKSMVACNWIDASASHGFPGLIISEEMSRESR
ncbi:hypothetical protein [Schlesneria sp. T3-172]|uniref:hypothetical protein n=1 Tax=Schlesneria sphaerica TaxID=3373610 RepID=UPI0037C5F0FE